MKLLTVQQWRLLAITAVLAVLFVAYPEIDLAIMRLLYDPESGFVLQGQPLSAVYKEFRAVFEWLFFGGVVLATLTRAFGRVLFGLTWQRLGVIWGTLVLGLGVIGNLLFKEQFGRARPEDVVQFGGTAAFSPPWIPVSECDSNCSFISGDAGLGFATIALALMVPRRWRLPAMAAAIGLGIAIGIMRMLTGSHFPSDVLFAGLLMAFVAMVLRYRLVDCDYRLPEHLRQRMPRTFLDDAPGR